MDAIIWIIVGFVLGVVIIIAAAVIVSKKKRAAVPNQQDSSFFIADYQKLIAEQLVTDEIDGPQLSAWFKANSTESDDVLFFIAKPTKKHSVMLGVSDYPVGLDIEHSLLQAVVESKKNQPLKIRLISFQSMADGVKQMLNEDGLAIITK